MKTLLLLLAMTFPAIAQHNMSKTIRLFDNTTGEPIGTITINGPNAYLRDLSGKHIHTTTVEADGSRTVRDPNGNIIKTVPAK